jgi:O-antigen/teichoic acid export membrane protein
MKRTLSFYTGFFIAAMVFMRACGVLSKIILARYITPYEYGIITLTVIALPVMFQFFTNFSFYDMLSHAKNGRKYFGFTVLYSVTLVLALIVLVFYEPIFSFLNLPLDSWGSVYLALMIAMFPLVILVDVMGLFRGLKEYSFSLYVSILPSVLRLLFVSLAIFVFNVKHFYLLLLIFATPSLVSLFIILAKKWRIIFSSLRTVVRPTKKMFIFGFSIFIISSFLGLGDGLIRMVISHDLGIEWQGYFDVSLTLVAILTFFSGALHFISVPEATDGKREDVLFKVGGLSDVSRALFSYLIYSIIILYFYSLQLVNIIFSEVYQIAAEYVIIIAIGHIFLFLQQFMAYLNVSYGETKVYRLLIFITIILLLSIPIFTHLFIQLFGFLGAYISIFLFTSIYSIATIITLKDMMPIRIIFNKIDRLFITFLITSLFLFFSKLSLIYGIILSAILFTFLIFWLGYLNKRLLRDLITAKTIQN